MSASPRRPAALVAFGGYATAGKDAAVDVLVAEFGFERTFMSKPLHDSLFALDPQVLVTEKEAARLHLPSSTRCWPYVSLTEELGYEQCKSIADYRRLLQVMGTEVGRRRFGPDVWLNQVMVECAHHRSQGCPIALTGVRFANELAAIRNVSGVAVWVDRPGVAPVNGHSSDNTLTSADFDVVLSNSGTLEDLAVAVRALGEAFAW